MNVEKIDSKNDPNDILQKIYVNIMKNKLRWKELKIIQLAINFMNRFRDDQ